MQLQHVIDREIDDRHTDVLYFARRASDFPCFVIIRFAEAFTSASVA